MSSTSSTPTKVTPTIQWEKLPADFILPDDPVENIYHPLLAAALREILHLAGFITPNMLNGRYWLESMNLFLEVWHGTRTQLTTYWLRWWDASGNLLPWADERIEQSLKQGKLDVITRLLTRKFGTIEPDLKARINHLSAVDLDELSEALLDLADVSALSSWLAQR